MDSSRRIEWIPIECSTWNNPEPASSGEEESESVPIFATGARPCGTLRLSIGLRCLLLMPT